MEPPRVGALFDEVGLPEKIDVGGRNLGNLKVVTERVWSRLLRSRRTERGEQGEAKREARDSWIHTLRFQIEAGRSM